MELLDDVGTKYSSDQLSGTMLDVLFRGIFEHMPLTEETLENTWHNLSLEKQLESQEKISDMPLDHYEKV